MNARQVLVLSFAVSGALLLAWQGRRSELRKLQEEWNSSLSQPSADRTHSLKQENWWEMFFPTLASESEDDPTNKVARPETLLGWDELEDSELATLVAREAQRWAESPSTPLANSEWQVEAGPGPFATMSFSGTGDDAAALAWLQHLLASPAGTRAYLSDPARIDLIAIEPNGLRLQAEFRIWPNSSFGRLTASGGAQ